MPVCRLRTYEPEDAEPLWEAAGVATEAVRPAAVLAFQDTDLVRLEIVCAVGNERSQRVAVRARAVREGLLRRRLILHGQPVDAVRSALCGSPRGSLHGPGARTFAALARANLASRRWPGLTRTALYALTLVLALISLAIYADIHDVAPPGASNAFVFVVVPIASWLLRAAVLVPLLVSRGRSSRSLP